MIVAADKADRPAAREDLAVVRYPYRVGRNAVIFAFDEHIAAVRLDTEGVVDEVAGRVAVEVAADDQAEVAAIGGQPVGHFGRRLQVDHMAGLDDEVQPSRQHGVGGDPLGDGDFGFADQLERRIAEAAGVDLAGHGEAEAFAAAAAQRFAEGDVGGAIERAVVAADAAVERPGQHAAVDEEIGRHAAGPQRAGRRRRSPDDHVAPGAEPGAVGAARCVAAEIDAAQDAVDVLDIRRTGHLQPIADGFEPAAVAAACRDAAVDVDARRGALVAFHHGRHRAHDDGAAGASRRQVGGRGAQ